MQTGWHASAGATIQARIPLLQAGEAQKQKSYCAVCWLPSPLTDEHVQLLNGTKDLLLKQQTPIR